ncbi:MAG: VWA domain-containing protein, partial [Acidobacteria bacterium]|nr:VWA domain-containing protein [Acidobacteriota bacterium]
MSLRVNCILSTVVLCASTALAQQSNPARTDFLPRDPGMALLKSNLLFKKQVNEVNLVLSVRDKKGHFVNGLGAGDFSIFDNDRRQTKITFFQNQTDLPLDIAVVLDSSASVGARFEAEQHAITQFLHQTIRHEDTAELFAFNQAIRVIAPINYNWREVSRRLKKVKPEGETALYDAVSAAADHLSENSWPARRIIILVSDGEENSSQITLSAAAAAALRA